MTRRLLAFFQHMPPYSGAAALRGRSIIGGLVEINFGAPDCDVRVFTTTPNPDMLPGAQVYTLSGVEVENAHGLVRRMLGELRVGWSAARAMFARQASGTVGLISSPAYLTALVICAWARWRHVPYVLELRDVYPQVYAEAGLIGRDSAIYRFFLARSRRMYRGAALVLVATQGLAREVSPEADATPVACVYNGFPHELLERRSAKHERFTVCFHGVLGFFQDIETLIAVAGRLQIHDIDVVVVGYGRKEDLLRQARLSNLRFLGRKSFEETIAEVERCHIGLCLRMDDGVSKDAFPVKVWEYLGLGIPSIVTPACEAGEFLSRHGCGMQLHTGDVNAIIESVLELKNEPARMQQMTSQCAAVASMYTRERMGLDAARLVKKAIDRSLAHSASVVGT